MEVKRLIEILQEYDESLDVKIGFMVNDDEFQLYVETVYIDSTEEETVVIIE